MSPVPGKYEYLRPVLIKLDTGFSQITLKFT